MFTSILRDRVNEYRYLEINNVYQEHKVDFDMAVLPQITFLYYILLLNTLEAISEIIVYIHRFS